jgi:adenosylcobinamide-GDP ribazoletransferase
MRALLSFFTVLPVRSAPLEAAAERAYLLPLVGLFTGAPGAALILLGYAMPPGVVATLALATVLLAAGLHHTDGVLDTGDALMVRGTPERRRMALKDTRVGTGGIGALFVVYAPALAALAALVGDAPLRAGLALLAGEVAARSAMLLTLAFGKPAEPGSSAAPFVQALRGRRRTFGSALALLAPPLLLSPLGGLAVLSALTVPLTALVALEVAWRAFGGVGGDTVGAAGELARGVLLILLSTVVPS